MLTLCLLTLALQKLKRSNDPVMAGLAVVHTGPKHSNTCCVAGMLTAGMLTAKTAQRQSHYKYTLQCITGFQTQSYSGLYTSDPLGMIDG